MADDLLWNASGGILNQRSINLAERARQARELDDVLRSFDSDEEEEGGDEGFGDLGWEATSLGSWSATSYEAGLAATAKAAAKAAAAAVGGAQIMRTVPSAEDNASEASTRLGSSQVPSTSGGSSVLSYGSSGAPPSTGGTSSGAPPSTAASSSAVSYISSASSSVYSAHSAPPLTFPLRPRPPASSTAGAGARSSRRGPTLPALPSLRDAGAAIDEEVDEEVGEEGDDRDHSRHSQALGHRQLGPVHTARPRSGLRWRTVRSGDVQRSTPRGSSSARAGEPPAAAYGY